MNVTFRQLRAFVHIAELGTFVDAARAVPVTASALSIVVAELENTLGFRVFDRTTRRVRLSAQGEEYLPYAQRVLQDLESAQRCAEALRNRKTGIVRIATSQLIAWTLMPAAFARSATKAPTRRAASTLPVACERRSVSRVEA